MNDKDCKAYIKTESFSKDLKRLIEHDKKAFDEPKGRQSKTISQSILINDFDTLWPKLKKGYSNELSMLAYSKIPHESRLPKHLKK